ncbi:MAG: glycosyltransferase family 4 protein [bacterium]|nr:glycosyltransferase family 4 protein [bacterium]
MTRVLVVAYYYPPRGGAGTQRFAKFCRYLPEFGLQPVVLTSGVVASDRNAPHDDPTLSGGQDGAQPVVERVDDPGRGSTKRRLMRSLRFFLDQDEWADAAADHAVRLVRQYEPEAVITTLSPFACYRIGLRLKREFDLPWLVDLRDPWSLDGWRRYRSFLHARSDLGHMRRALTTADCVIANVPEAAREFEALGAPRDRTVVIPNGYDEPDFATVDPSPFAADGSDDYYRIVHMGTFHPVDAPPGFTTNRLLLQRHRQIAPLGRTGNYLLHAAARLRTEDTTAFARLRIELFGNVDESHRRLIDELDLSDTVVLHGYVSHRETIAALCGADAVFVPLHDVPANERALVVPGKLYEALASERPVLAALPPGDGADLVRGFHAGIVVPPTDTAALARAMRRLIVDGAGGVTRARLGAFTRRHLTGLLATAIDATIRRASAIAVESPWVASGVQKSP